MKTNSSKQHDLPYPRPTELRQPSQPPEAPLMEDKPPRETELHVESAPSFSDQSHTAEVQNSSTSRVPQVPLIQDVSQYTNTHFGDSSSESASTTLEELAHLVRLAKYQERKRSQLRIRLQRSLVSTALSARLARCGDLAHRTLVDNFRADDKKTFATLYNAIDDVKKSCDAMRRYSLLEPELDAGRLNSDQVEEPGSFSTFMHDIPSQARETLLHFLSQIRTNPEFLASRISSLTTAELSALTTFHQGLEPIDSVLPFHTRTKGHTPNSNRNSTHVPSPVERLLSFQRHDALSALIHTCFANSAGPDSAEDIRRTDVWATVCAKLITDNRSGTESFICSVLNIWTSMRDWSGKSNMEWYLMKILEDGAFLLEKAEDQAGTRIHVEPRNAKDSIAADEFYDAAIKGLFEVVDDQGAGGIPEGLLELGNAILRKLDSKKHGATRIFLVSKWLFSVFLMNAIVHPESHCMMAEYHITEYGRQKILKEVAMRAMRLVVDLTWKQSAATPPEIRSHIENIMARFRTKSSRSNPKLLPARSITSLRETVEVHPYLVVSPSDLVTMVNALYPEKRPASSSLERDLHFNGLRSAASSISGISGISMPLAVPQPSSRPFDTTSIISNSGSSIYSDTTSREPLLDEGSSTAHRFSSTSISSMSQPSRSEDDGYKLRTAIREMSRTLGTEVASGSCHPCAEQWAVLFMNSDGLHLSTQMLHDLHDEDEEEEDTTSSDSDFEQNETGPDLAKDYHQLRDSILKLVEEYEIPQTNSMKKSKTFSNRTVTLESPGKKVRNSKAKPSGIVVRSRNPYRIRDPSPNGERFDSHMSAGHSSRQRTTGDVGDRADATETSSSVLLMMLEAAEKQCQAQCDFVNSHLYWKTAQQLLHLSSPSLVRDGFVSLLSIFSRGPRDSIRSSASAIEEYDAWLVWLRQSQERHDVTIDSMMRRLRALRDKMWYVTDVRNSAAYEGARNVAVALKTMGAPTNNKNLPASNNRPRHMSRPSTNNFLLKTEAQVLDILAASEEHGGPNKLSDEQSEKTIRYLIQFGIENFCKGEERIHRFCLEIETCINKLVGDSLMEGPVLWSSELYSRDKQFLDTGRQKGDLVITELGALSISGSHAQESETSRRSLRGVEIPSTPRSGARDLRAMSARNESQQSFDSGRWSMPRASITGDLMDSQDYFGMASPVLTIDSATTFWSPFQTRVTSPSTSMGSHRPGTASTTNETVMQTSQENKSALVKQEFLADLKRTLTSLLTSDLGTLVFARGSETDSWFSGELGQECMDRKECQDRRARRKNRKRVIEKKKSSRNLRSAHKSDLAGLDDSRENKPDMAGGTTARANADTSSGTQSLADSTSTIESLHASSRHKAALDSSPLDFPYKSSFRRLLSMLSVHPNPYAKLNALYELEHLIIASLTAMPRRRAVRQDSYTTCPQSSGHGSDFGSREYAGNTHRAMNLDEAIVNCKERRLSTIQADTSPTLRRKTSNLVPSNPPLASTDAIVEVLQDLFREEGMRPKTLFRDLQFIAAFVPAAILDKTEKGKAFWDASLAALGLKQDVCRTLVEIADEIVLHFTRTRQASSLATSLPSGESKDNPTGLENEQHVIKYSMQDAAKMWTITAKEGDPVAERELAIFYLTHPELVERTTLPLAKPREIFKAQVMEMHGGGSGGGWAGTGGVREWVGAGTAKDGDRERSDPATMCVAYHWMELSAVGGDELAKKYLRQREELNAIP
ncbi:MAG: hypothetical protein M1818_001911 [Claussenomyces sp. TS43310]|nr:MAG: hypothetical protein M1818_001911 [Claussenomyces sp. TS43310]